MIVANYEHQPDTSMEKFVTDVHYHGHNNDFGKNLSLSETVRQDWNNYLNSREGLELARAQTEDGENVGNIGIIPVEGAIYGITRLDNGEILLFSGTNPYESLGREADIFRLTLEDMITAKLGEEDMHRFRRSYDKGHVTIADLIGEELATKQSLLEFYIQLAEDSGSTPELREKYSRIVKSIENDIATIDRYKDVYEQKSNNKKTKSEDTESSLEAAVEDSEDYDSDVAEDNVIELSVYDKDSEQYDATEATEEEGAQDSDCEECAESEAA